MNKIIQYSFLILLVLMVLSCQSQNKKQSNKEEINYNMKKTNQQWKEVLSPAQFHVLREKGTERPNTGEYNLHFKKGTYTCAACDAALFESSNKYESHCGWPSFDEAIEGTIEYKKDSSLGTMRTEILCANCGGHLGHIFDDGPQETTGKRFCVNSLSLDFKKKEQ